MQPDDFKKIDEQFAKSGVELKYVDIAYRKFIESVKAGIQESLDTKQKEPSSAELRKICEQSLREPILQSYVELAKVSKEAEEKAIRGTRPNRFLSVLGGIIVGIVANILFLALLLLSFSAGREEWLSILKALGLNTGTP